MAEGDAHSALAEDEDDSSATDSDDQESEAPVELLVTGRAKRAGAGSRIQKLIEQEEDELAEYIKKNAEDVDSEEDVDFVGDEDEAVSDAELDSSSDDDDQGPSKADEDLEGEKQLQKQERAEKQKKRKAQAGFQAPSTVRKRARADTKGTGASILPITPVPKPKKKAERISWIPNVDEGAVRSSSRKQTVKNKEAIHLRMAEKEKHRVKQMKHMEEAERKRQAAKAPPMTQAERMAEAVRIERKNAKSLNRWEESERKRAEAQKAKLEALHSRQLQGPVITWWSGLTRWVNGKLSQVGIREIREAEKVVEPLEVGQIMNGTHNDQPVNGLPPAESNGDSFATTATHIQPTPSIQYEAVPPPTDNIDQPISTAFEPTPSLGLLDGIHYYASLPSQDGNGTITSHGRPPLPNIGNSPSQHPYNMGPDPIEHPAAFVEKATSPLRPEPIVVPQPPPPGPIVEYASRTLVALRNIDNNNAMNMPELQSSVLLKKKNNKIQSECCSGVELPLIAHANASGRTCTRTLRHHWISCEVPRSENWSRLRGFVRLQRDPKTAQWRIEMEQLARLLCWLHHSCSPWCT